MQPSVRPMAPQDKPAVMQILKTTPEFKPDEVIIAEELIDCYLSDPDGSGYPTLVAEINSKVAGYICLGPTPLTEGTWDIYWIAVARDKQGKGIGSVLLDAAEKTNRSAYSAESGPFIRRDCFGNAVQIDVAHSSFCQV